VRAIGPRYLISAVARIFQPGAQVDHVLVLEGPQGKMKSTALRKLAIRDQWFSDRLSPISSKDAAIEITGVLFVEIAEMHALIKAAASASKSFITRRHDRFRWPYGKHLGSLPRQCVFAATINPPSDGQYLDDPTGARRFWPVAVRGTIDIAGLVQVRDQLWAEAVARFRSGSPWWLETPELEALATAEQVKRFVADPWQVPIERWLENRTDVSIAEVLVALGLPVERHTQLMVNRVQRILTRIFGFKRYRPNRKGEPRTPRYERNQP
jgi:predicted P-loop ATPase